MRNHCISTIPAAFAICLSILIINGCSLFVLESNLSPDEYMPKKNLLIIDESLYPQIKDRVETYRTDISNEGVQSDIVLWNSTDDHTDLKLLLQSYQGGADCGILIGNIPPVFYEQTAFGVYEVFPSDLYYMDLDSTWTDSNRNGYFDSHSELEIDFFVSRITGNAAEICFYFDKLHGYRTGTGSTPIYDGAFIFKDDDWHNNYRNNDFGLKSIYENIDFYQDEVNTTKSAYISKVSGRGTEYVYQWIHSYPPALFVDEDGGYQIIRADDIDRTTFKGNFYNLFDCQAARFTVRNIAGNYLTKTDSCIAILGSTKTGGVFYPVEFHKSLGIGACWGAAYKSWYNTEGYSDDTWNLGIIIMGDPVIRPRYASAADMTSGKRSLSNVIPISDEEKEDMYKTLSGFTAPKELPEDLLYELEQSLKDY